MAGAAPNAGHHAVTELERQGLVTGIITQNVDGLHQSAGARALIELHGSLYRVICLGCGDSMSRTELHTRLGQANPQFEARATRINPDGDVDLDDDQLDGFHTVSCQTCNGGMLKPDVVFFGENVPAPRVAECFALVESARLLLVLGSSLTVMSGRRFVLRAAKLGVPVAIVNRGRTRGDDYATLTFLQWYVNEQREEEALMRTVLDRIRLIGDGPQSLYFIDKEMDALNQAALAAEASGTTE